MKTEMDVFWLAGRGSTSGKINWERLLVAFLLLNGLPAFTVWKLRARDLPQPAIEKQEAPTSTVTPEDEAILRELMQRYEKGAF